MTTGITLLRAITGKVRPPRALAVDRPLGYPLGEPGNPALQRRILEAALALSDREEVPLVEPFEG